MSATPDTPDSDVSRDNGVAFDELATRAGAALRRPAPTDGVDQIAERRRRQRVLQASIAASVTAALLIGGLVVLASRDDGHGLRPADSVPTITDLEVVEAGTLSGYPWPRYSPDGALLAVQTDSGVGIYDSAALTLLDELPCPTSIGTLPESVGTSSDQYRVWDVAATAQWDDETMAILHLPLGDMCHVSVSADGSRALTNADALGRGVCGCSLLWDTSDGSVIAVIPGSAAGFSADGSTLIIKGGPATLSLFDASTGALLTSTIDDISITAFSPDGGHALAWGRSRNTDGSTPSATIYDMQTLTPVATLSTGSPDEVMGIVDAVFDDTNRRLATFAESGVTIWDASTGIELQRIPIQFDYSGFEGYGGAFSPGGAMIAVPQDGHITIFDSSTGVQLADLEVDGWIRPHTAVFSSDGLSLATAFDAEIDETRVRVWSLHID